MDKDLTPTPKSLTTTANVISELARGLKNVLRIEDEDEEFDLLSILSEESNLSEKIKISENQNYDDTLIYSENDKPNLRSSLQEEDKIPLTEDELKKCMELIRFYQDLPPKQVPFSPIHEIKNQNQTGICDHGCAEYF